MTDDLGPTVPGDPGDDADPQHDDALVDALKAALPPDPLPPGLLDRARSLSTLLDLDRDLAELLESSAAEPAGMRGTAIAPERSTFRSPGGDVVVETTHRAGGLTGVVVRGDVVEVGLESEHGGVATAEVDELGRFAFPAVPATVVRLRFRLRPSGSDRAPVTSEWFLLENPGPS
jgi:hypothetical protein